MFFGQHGLSQKTVKKVVRKTAVSVKFTDFVKTRS